VQRSQSEKSRDNKEHSECGKTGKRSTGEEGSRNHCTRNTEKAKHNTMLKALNK